MPLSYFLSLPLSSLTNSLFPHLLPLPTRLTIKGVALVYEQLLGFDGDEFYTATWPQLAGRKFKECVELFPAAVAIGVVDRFDGSVTLLPEPDYMLSAETGIIVVAEDDDAYECLTVMI